MSKPVMRKLFKFQGRRNRKSYNLYMLLSIAAMFIIMFMLNSFFPPFRLDLFVILLVPFIVSSLAIVSQRLRDINHSGWWAALYYVPLVGLVLFLYLAFKRGTIGDNSFDYDPLGLVS